MIIIVMKKIVQIVEMVNWLSLWLNQVLHMIIVARKR